MSCPECCTWCCPCLSSTKKTSKFSYVRYTQQKISDGVQPEKVFEFPQNKSDVNTHPQMFVEAMSVIRNQPTSLEGYQQVPKWHLYDTVGAELDDEGDDTFSSKRLSLPLIRPSVKSTLRKMSLPVENYGVCEQLQPPVSTQRRRDLKVRRPSSPFYLPMLEESTLQQENELPVLQFSLLYDLQRNIFTVHLHHVSGLPENDRRGMMNPFVVIYMMPNKEEVFESEVIHQTLNPEFDQSFEFHQQHPDDIQQKTLIFKVYDNSKSKLIGGVAFPLEDADIFGVVMRMQIDQDLSEVSRIYYCLSNELIKSSRVYLPGNCSLKLAYQYYLGLKLNFL